MFGSEILDVVIGLMLLYLILSMMASGVNEWISNRLDRRAIDLKDFIDRLIYSALKGDYSKRIQINFYDHPTIGNVSDKPLLKARIAAATISPVQIEAETQLAPSRWLVGFIDVVFNLLSGIWGVIFNTQKKVLPTYIKSEYFVESILTAISNVDAVPNADGTLSQPPSLIVTVKDLREALDKLPSDSQLTQVLKAALDQADNKIENVTNYLEDWFNKQMDYVRGMYKEWAQRILLFLGLLLAIALNADSIYIAEALLRNPSMRAAVVEYAQNVSGDNDQTPQMTLPELQAALDKIQLPLGWNKENLPDMSNYSTGDTVIWVIKKILGIFITAFAIAQGAPFWFDLLDKITNLRYNEKPDDKKPKAEKPAEEAQPQAAPPQPATGTAKP